MGSTEGPRKPRPSHGRAVTTKATTSLGYNNHNNCSNKKKNNNRNNYNRNNSKEGLRGRRTKVLGVRTRNTVMETGGRPLARRLGGPFDGQPGHRKERAPLRRPHRTCDRGSRGSASAPKEGFLERRRSSWQLACRSVRQVGTEMPAELGQQVAEELKLAHAEKLCRRTSERRMCTWALRLVLEFLHLSANK